jgi:hypothetical protein
MKTPFLVCQFSHGASAAKKGCAGRAEDHQKRKLRAKKTLNRAMRDPYTKSFV